MIDSTHHYSTTLNGGVITVELDLSIPSYLPRLVAVWFEQTDILPILDDNTITALDMEAERAYLGGNVGDFDPSRDAHRLGD